MNLPPDHVVQVTGRFWRAGFLGQDEQLLAPAGAPNGRWHHDGQNALYLSGSPEGCQVALRAYVKPTDPSRGIFPFQTRAARVVDLRSPPTREQLQVKLNDLHVFWANLHAAGKTSPTWELADRLRASGVNGVLTPSRSRPDLTHLTLFHWNCENGPTVHSDGPPIPFDPHYKIGDA